MNKKTKIILIFLAIFVIFSAGAVIGYNKVCINPEAQMLRELQQKKNLSEADKEKIKSLPILEIEETKNCAFWNISKKEKKRIIEEKRKGHENYLQEQEKQKQQGLLDPQKLSFPELGIRTIDQALQSSTFRQINAWQGYLDNSLILVAAGSNYTNPLQGMLVVLKGGFGGQQQIYFTPTLTGPIKIIAEKNGILTFKSIAGEYEVYRENIDKREKIKVPGNIIYYFNLRTKMFQ